MNREAYYEHLYLNALSRVSTEVAARWSVESMLCALAWDYGAALGLLDQLQWSGDFCDGPACPECLSAPWHRHASSCQLGLFLRGAP